MSQYRHEVFRWPFSFPSTNITINRDTGGSAVVNIPAGIYICDGSGSVVAPLDFVKAFRDKVQAAITAIGGTAVIVGRMTTDGRYQYENTTADGARYMMDPNATVEAILGATSANYFAGKLLVARASVGTLTYTYQMSHQWHPMMDSQRDTGEVGKQLVTAGLNLRGQERRVVRSSARWQKRKIGWQFLPAAVMLDDRADDAAYASYVGWTAGEDNTWENMLAYLLSAYSGNPYLDNRVYVYKYNDPATAVREGPYDVILSESRPNQEGVDYDDFVADMGTEHYPCHIVLRLQ